jgi:hypothetical protein
VQLTDDGGSTPYLSRDKSTITGRKIAHPHHVPARKSGWNSIKVEFQARGFVRRARIGAGRA